MVMSITATAFRSPDPRGYRHRPAAGPCPRRRWDADWSVIWREECNDFDISCLEIILGDDRTVGRIYVVGLYA